MIPDRPTDLGLSETFAGERRGPLANLYQTVETAALYRDDEAFDEAALDLGLSYFAGLETVNWGRLQLRLTALNEFDNFSGIDGLDNGAYAAQSGVSRYSVEQLGLPPHRTAVP